VPETLPASSGIAARAPVGLAARVFGVIFSPGDTYQEVVRRPRALGALAVVAITIGLSSFLFLSTAVGQTALLDQQARFMESFGRDVPDEVYARIEAGANLQRYFALLGVLVSVPVGCAIVAALVLVVFNAVLGGDASFLQAYALVAHSQILLALQQLFVTPLNYARETMTSATNLMVFVPMLDEATFAARFLGWIDLFRIWWIVSLAIGLGVLYKRKAGPIGWTFIAIYVGIALVVAGVMTAVAGA
jgi:hypothetical protein